MDTIPAKMQPQHDAIVALTDVFCREKLTEEYGLMCSQLVGALARKRPSPLANGTAAAWACGIVRVIGWVNFLDDSTEKLHMKLTEIDKHFGVSSGTGQAKSKAIRTMFKIHPFDTDWTLPSKMDRNPVAWMVQLSNGMIADVRSLPREVQVEAFERGLIPYIPAERKQPEEEKEAP